MSEFATKHGGLWVRTFGEGRPGVVALHGFTLHGGMWESLADLISVPVAAPDLPGHGHTTVRPVTMRTAVDTVAAYLGECGRPLLLGYSQGGRVAMQIALTYPDLISALVVVGTSPGLTGRERKLREVADAALANRIERIGIVSFIDEWLANPLLAPDRVDQAARDADRNMRLENSAEGIAAALRGMGQASVADVSDRIGDLDMPVSFIAGAGDSKYAALATTMARSLGIQPDIVPDTGHNVVREAPQAVAEVVNRLLQSE